MGIRANYYNKDFERIRKESKDSGLNLRPIGYLNTSREPSTQKIDFYFTLNNERLSDKDGITFTDPIYGFYSNFRRISKNTFTLTISSSMAKRFEIGSWFTLSNFNGENWFQVTSLDIVDPITNIDIFLSYHSLYGSGNVVKLTCKKLNTGSKFSKLKKRYKTKDYIFPLNQYDNGYSNEEIFEFTKNFTPIPEKYYDSCI